MSMRSSDLLPLSELGRHEKARAAITQARKLKGNWEAIARMMTRNSNVTIELHAGYTSATDGTVIYVRVPIELGDMQEHDRSVCGQRGEDLLLLCERCAVLEDVNITIIHEVAHIAFDTFKQVDAYEQAHILQHAIKLEAEGKPDSKRAQVIQERIDTAPDRVKNDYMNLSQLVSPYLPDIINACEDIRVNSMMRKYRPGTEVMFNAQTNKVFSKGWKRNDGSIGTWHQAPPNAQAVIGVYCLTGGMDIRGKISDDVADRLLSSPSLLELCDRMRESASARDVYNLSIPLLEELRKLGFCRTPDDPEDEPMPSMDQEPDPNENGDSDDTEDQEGQDSSGTDGGEQQPPDGDTPDPGEDNEGGDDGTPGGSEGDMDPDSSEGDDQSGESGVAPGGSDPDGDSDGESGDSDAGEDTGSGASTEEEADGTGGDSSDNSSDDGTGSDPGSEADGSDGGSEDSPTGNPDDSEGGSGSDSAEGGHDSDDGTAGGTEASGSSPDDGPSDPVRDEGTGSSSEDVAESDDGAASPDQNGDGEAPGSVPPDGSSDRSGDQGSDEDDQHNSDSSDASDGHGEPGQDEDAGQGPDAGDTAEADPSEAGATGESDRSDHDSDESSESESAGDASGASGSADGSGGATESPAQPGDSQPLDAPDQPQDTGQDGAQPPAEGSDDLGHPADQDGAHSADKDSAEAGPQGLPPADPERDGTPDEVAELLKVFGRHDDEDLRSATPSERHEQMLDQEAIEISLNQMDHFDSPSLNIGGVTEYTHDREGEWVDVRFRRPGYRGKQPEIKVEERILAPSLQRMRLAFVENRRGKVTTNLAEGKVNGRALGSKVPTKDERIFKKKSQPGRRDYFVVIGIDVSGSTGEDIGGGMIRLDMMKAAVAAKAELLHRLGIPFCIYGHSGNYASLAMFTIKSDREPWAKPARQALAELQPYSANLDGHTLEFYRKVAERRTETDKLILYYTDGHMPLANFDEELEILQREIKHCQRAGIKLVGIGVNTDSPTRHGLDTIRLDDLSDVPKVVTELRKRLAP